MKITAYAAELIGAFCLTLLVSIGASEVLLPVPTPIVAALTLGTFVYTVGSVSGAHLNPAVTIGLLSVGKIAKYDAAMYVLAQVVGAVLAMIVGPTYAGLDLPSGYDSDVIIGIAEAIGTFFLAIGVASVVYKKTPADIAGVVIGTSLLLGILATANISNGILNPAVAIGFKSANVMYILGPIVGSIVGFWVYRWLIGAT